MKKFLIVVLCLIPYCLLSSETATIPKTFVYDAESTKKLQTLVDKDELTSPKQRKTAQSLIEARANPNVSTLMLTAVRKNYIDLTRCCLEHGVEVNVPNGEKSLINEARSVKILQCLVEKHPHLIHVKDNLQNSVLHQAVACNQSLGILAYLCDAGVNPTEGDMGRTTPLHTLFSASKEYYWNTLEYKRNILEKAAILMWYGADPHVASVYGVVPLVHVQTFAPEFFDQVRALHPAVLDVKAQYTEKYRKTLYEILGGYIKNDPTSVVIEHMGEPSWSELCWGPIQRHIKQQIIAQKQAVRQQRPRKTRRKRACTSDAKRQRTS